MEPVSMHPSWFGLIDRSWIDSLDSSAFLTRCRNGLATRAELHCFVRQQQHYSRHFTRYLCALLANVADDGDRLELMRNLFEEMGFGSFGSTPHSAIYATMMDRMGVARDIPAFTATVRLIETMCDCCESADPLVGLGALGLGAEAIVPHVYSQIVMGFQAVGEEPENLEFFRIHIEGDDAHAVTMREIIQREVERDSSCRIAVRSAAHRAILARAAFFEEITRRTTAEAVTVRYVGSHAAPQF